MNNTPTNNTQLERFKEAAREHETDQSDDALDKVFGKLDLKREPEKEEKQKGGDKQSPLP